MDLERGSIVFGGVPPRLILLIVFTNWLCGSPSSSWATWPSGGPTEPEGEGADRRLWTATTRGHLAARQGPALQSQCMSA